MDSRGTFEQACKDKRRYRTRAEAKKAAKNTGQVLRSKMMPYCCEYCGQHHIGHMDGFGTGRRHRWSSTEGGGDSVRDYRANPTA